MLEFVGPSGAVQLLGVKLVGVTAENGRKLVFTVLFLLLLWAASRVVEAVLRRTAHGRRLRFWTAQAARLALVALGFVGLVSIWFDDPTRVTTALGLFSAGLAFALQRVITALAGYFVILRGTLFNVGDRIKMGGVRGDVVGIGLLQTTIMEMGQPPSVQQDDPGMWVQARQYTGRIVSVTNAKIFDEPVYNYTRDFPYVWEEIQIPVPYDADRRRAEAILLEAATRHTEDLTEMSAPAVAELERRFFMRATELAPRVYYRLTDNWLELSVRFIGEEHGMRGLKDRISRDILDGFEAAGMGLASATFQIVGAPPLEVRAVVRNGDGPSGPRGGHPTGNGQRDAESAAR